MPLSLRIVLAALVPTVALVALGGFQIRARALEATAAQDELVRTEAIELLGLVQSANVVPEAISVADRAGGGLIGGVMDQTLVDLTGANFRAVDDQRVARYVELQEVAGPELLALFDQQRYTADALTEARFDGDVPSEVVDEAIEARAAVDAALSVFFQSSSSDAWVVYSAVIDALRESWTEYIYYVPTLRGERVASLSELNRLTGRRQLATERVANVLPPDLRDDIAAVIATPSYSLWVEAVDTAPLIVAGVESPMEATSLWSLSNEALSLAESIERISSEAVGLVRQDLADEAAAARAQQRQLWFFVMGLGVITLGLTLLILWSLLVPLQRLTRRARSLAEGRLEDDIATISGRDELTRLASTIEDVASGLRHLDRQVQAIAAGDLDDPSLAEPAPGPVGAYVQERVEALRDASGALLAEASTDSLTGLLNRRGLVDTLEAQDSGRRETDSTRRRAIVFVDLDKFKAVNDDYGHKHGDAVLISVGRRLQQFVRANDLVARLGGDEFVLVSEGFDPQNINIVLERVEAHLTQPIEFEGVVHQVGCSVGMAWLDGDADLDSAIDIADRRMLAVKVERGSARR